MGVTGTWLIGAGNLGRALLSGWAAAGITPAGLAVVDPGLPTLPGGLPVLPNLPAGPAPACVVIAVKPQGFGPLAETLRPRLAGDSLVISVMAGIRIDRLRAALGPCPIARVMPNLAVALLRGASAAHAPGLDEDRRRLLDALFAPLGILEWVADEALLDVATALSGSGPAFLFRFIQALTQAAAGLGLDPAQADRLARATVDGAAAMARGSDASPADLAAAVTSPNGTTAAGLGVLDADDALATLVYRTLDAATRRGRALSGA